MKIPVHQAAATFTVTPVDNALLDGTPTVTITASAAGHFLDSNVAPNLRNTALGLITVAFSEPVTGVDVADFLLTRNELAVVLEGVAVTQVTQSRYTLDLSSKTGDEGNYVLTLAPVALVVTEVTPSQYMLDLSNVTAESGVYQLRLQASGSNIADTAGNLFTSDGADQWIVVEPWQSLTHPCDVNVDGQITPLDVLLVINEINSRGAGPLPWPYQPDRPPPPPPPYVDVSRDGQLTPLDVLTIVNYINTVGPGPVPGTSSSLGLGVASAEGESPGDQPETTGEYANDVLRRLPLPAGVSTGGEATRARVATSPLDGRVDRLSVPAPGAARGPRSLKDAPVGTDAAFRRPGWTRTELTHIETELWWAETEQALSLIALDVAAASDRR